MSIPRARKRQRSYYLTRRDLAALSTAFKQAFPDLVFATIHPDRRVAYCSSMELVESPTGDAWRLPAEWEPDWALRYPNIPDVGYVIANFPDCHFSFECRAKILRNQTGTDREVYVHGLSRIFAVYDQLDPDTRRFIEKIYRLLGKFTTNKFLQIEPDSGRVLRQVNDYFESAGHDVLFNCRKHSDHFVTCCGTDQASGERYFYVPTDAWSPPHWLVALDGEAGAALPTPT